MYRAIKKQYKLVLLGDANCGKTQFVNRLQGRFDTRYVATLGVEVTPIADFGANCTFSVWDTAGQEKFGGLVKGYYEGADCGVVFYDASSALTCENAVQWARNFRDVNPTKPLVVVGSKNDKKKAPVDLNALKHFTHHFAEISTRDDSADAMRLITKIASIVHGPDAKM